MNASKGLTRFLGLATLATVLVACGHEESVQLTLITAPRDGQFVDDDLVELMEGQALGVRVVALRDGEAQEGWSIEPTADNPGILEVRPAVEENVFVLSGAAPGLTRLIFLLDGRYEVPVEIDVKERPPFKPTVEPPDFGGAGGVGGAEGE